MKISIDWLNDYIDLTKHSAEEIAELLTMKTCEVEKVEPFMAHLDDIVVGHVESVVRHPDADKLVICKVNNGSEELQIVTGAPNVVEGKKYPLAQIGVTLPGGMTMKKVKLRGKESFGMLCSSQELELEDFELGSEFSSHEKGLLTLPDNLKTGQRLSEVLPVTDTLLDIDNKSITHRPDLWGHFGFARELAAVLGQPLKTDFADSKFKSTAKVDEEMKPPAIEIENEAALNYSGAQLENVKIVPSGIKLQARLLAAGMRPINNVVDVSNYVMLELGQPNHAFDRNTLGNKIVINYSKNGETIKTLDEKEHKLPGQIVLIRNEKEPIALGGVMGGFDTEVTEGTQKLFLESATFHRSDIRRAVSKLGVRTEASQRFEKGQTPANAEVAIHRFATLLNETCPDLKMGEINSEFAEKPLKNKIVTTFSYLRERLGNIEISNKEILDIFTSLQMQCNEKEDELTVTVPTYRSYFDLTMADDLVEELGRMIGYQQITTEPVLVSCEVPQYKNHKRELEHRLRALLSTGYNFTEVYNYAFHSERDIKNDTRFAKKAVEMANAIHQDQAFLRISPLPGLLHNIQAYHREYSSLRTYEIERLFLEKGKDELPEQPWFVAGALVDQRPADEMMALLSTMLADLAIRLGFDASDLEWHNLEGENIFHPGRAGLIKLRVGKNSIDLIKWGQVHPRLTDEADLGEVFYFETLLDTLLEATSHQKAYRPVVRYPGSDFEVTVLLDRLQPFADVINAVGRPKKGNGNDSYLESLEHVMTYTGEQIAADKKAVSIRVKWRNNSRTLESEEIKNLQNGLIKRLEKANMPLRS